MRLIMNSCLLLDNGPVCSLWSSLRDRSVVSENVDPNMVPLSYSYCRSKSTARWGNLPLFPPGNRTKRPSLYAKPYEIPFPGGRCRANINKTLAVKTFEGMPGVEHQVETVKMYVLGKVYLLSRQLEGYLFRLPNIEGLSVCSPKGIGRAGRTEIAGTGVNRLRNLLRVERRIKEVVTSGITTWRSTLGGARLVGHHILEYGAEAQFGWYCSTQGADARGNICHAFKKLQSM
jgi:hypothetical protein